MIRMSLPLILAVGLVAPAMAQSGAAAIGPTLLLHGNYCGPGNNAPAAPVDALDMACAHHDACTPDGRLPSRACNLRLQIEAERVADDPRQPEDLRMLAGLIASGAAMMPSEPSGTLAQVGASAAARPATRPASVRRTVPGQTEDVGE